jgi:hypothetical protein
MFHPVSGRWHSCILTHLSLTKQHILFIDIHQTGGKLKITLQAGTFCCSQIAREADKSTFYKCIQEFHSSPLLCLT